MNPLINTSRARKVDVNFSDYDTIPLSFKLNDISVTPKVPIDLSGYGFSFHLKYGEQEKKVYPIAAGQNSTDYLSRPTAFVLDMKLMWDDIRDNYFNQGNRLIMVVTMPDSQIYTYIVFNINGSKY